MCWLRGCALGVAAVGLGAGTAAGQLDTRLVAGGFSSPLYVTHAPGVANTLYVVEKGGQIKTVNTSNGQVTPFLNLNTVDGTQFLAAGAEEGLLGLAFHPNFTNPASRFLYVNYTWGTGDLRVERYTVQGQGIGTVDPTSRQTVLQIAHPTFENHNGGWLGFHPTNNLLYIATGDGGSGYDPNGNGQRTDTLLGKILRVNVDADAFPADPDRNYTVPPNNNTLPGSNPDIPGGATVLPEIWAYGLRNPWRNSFDRQNGNLYIGDVGQDSWEEINFRSNAATQTANFGWRLREGLLQTPLNGGPEPPDNVNPIRVYGHDLGQSVTGGYAYRGPTLFDNGQSLDGTYFYGDAVSGRMWSFRFDGTTVTDFQERTGELGTASNGNTVDNVVSFGEDQAGNLYVVDFGGEVYQIVPVPEPAALLLAAPVLGWWARRTLAGRRAGGKPTRHPNHPDPGRVG